MLPTQYASSIQALVTLRFVKEATFEPSTLGTRGMLTPYAAERETPTSLPTPFSGSSFQTTITPTREIAVVITNHHDDTAGPNICRNERNENERNELYPPTGICKRRAVKVEKPSPDIMMDRN
jgi:hypothetical protein